MGHRRRGFTLIEMLGVLVIMALLSAAASVMLNGSRRAADLQASIEQIQETDSTTRSLARSLDQPISFSISMESGALARSQGISTLLLGYLPGDVRIDRIRIGEDVMDFGSATLSMNARGLTTSYAIHLKSAGGGTQWIVFAGLTGQMLKVSDEDLDPILQQTSRPIGSDPD